jgi:hypothetical protein
MTYTIEALDDKVDHVRAGSFERCVRVPARR